MKKIILFIALGVILGGLIAYSAMRYIAGQRVEDEIAGFVDKTPTLEKINYGKIRVGIIWPAIHLEKIHIKLAEYAQPILIDQIDLVVQKRGHSIPLQAQAEIRGVHLSTHHGLFQAVAAELQAMEYDDVVGTAVLDYQYDPSVKRLYLNNVSFQAEGMGRLQFELTLTNFNLSGLVAKGEQINTVSLLLALPTMGIASGRFTYRDDSLVQRLSRLNFQQSGQKQSVYWHHVLTQILAKEKNEQIRRSISVLQKFIDHPDFITVTLRPATSVPLLRLIWMNKPVDLLKLFNVHITI